MNECKQRKTAFTLLEVMIALGIMSLLLSVILIPLRLGFDSLHVGQARSNNQTAIQSTLSDMETDIRRAGYVFPNTAMVGITDQKPYQPTVGGPALGPYTRAKDAATAIGTIAASDCPFTSGVFWSNPSRLDMIPTKVDTATGMITLDNKIVTYYTRRLYITQPYDPIDNPLVLFRAEYSSDAATADIADTHVASSCGTGTGKGNFKWLAHNAYGEANLEDAPILASQTLATPRGLGLVASRSFRVNNGFPTSGTLTADQEAPFKPDSSFTCLDTDGDGKIDRVNISLAIVSYDTSSNGSLRNGQPSGQALRAERTVVLPNIQ